MPWFRRSRGAAAVAESSTLWDAPADAEAASVPAATTTAQPVYRPLRAGEAVPGDPHVAVRIQGREGEWSCVGTMECGSMVYALVVPWVGQERYHGVRSVVARERVLVPLQPGEVVPSAAVVPLKRRKRGGRGR